jgi:endonuclease/exonuclease/phosphatase family metal-dependent hydrolase
MRIFSYNILDGGEGRADPLAEVIAAQNAEVVALIEADDEAVLDRIARRLKMDFIRAEGNKSAVALLSRWPIRDTINRAPQHPELTKCFLQATVTDPQTKDWNFAVVHLQHRAGEEHEQIREREIDIVLKTLEPLRFAGTPHILLGDFNANSPIQKIDLDKCKPSTREQAAANGGVIPRRVIQTILDADYIDTFAAVRPGEAQTQGTFTTQHPEQRVDYIFTHSIAKERIKAAWIEYDRLAKFASDHFPVGAEID